MKLLKQHFNTVKMYETKYTFELFFLIKNVSFSTPHKKLRST